MRLGLLLLFIAVPLIELALLIKIGEQIGILATIGIVIATAVTGTWVLQQQGLRTMHRLQESMARGEPPVEPVVDGMFLLMAGAFLLTPGVLTDIVGFALLVPGIRRRIAKWAFAKMLRSGKVHMTTYTASDQHNHGANEPGRTRHPPGRGPVIDGEFERVDENSTNQKP
jgi:UPF0716 protein FxsA